MASSIYQLARQRIAGATIKAPTKKVTLSACGHIVKAKEAKKQREKHEPTPEEIEERSMISPDYARNFICDFILGKKQEIGQLSLF